LVRGPASPKRGGGKGRFGRGGAQKCLKSPLRVHTHAKTAHVRVFHADILLRHSTRPTHRFLRGIIHKEEKLKRKI